MKNNNLIQVILNEDVKAVHTEIQSGANVNMRWRLNQTPLHIATAENNEEIVRLLVSAGADVKGEMEGGLTPLHIAVLMQNPAVVRCLLDAGAQENTPDREGKTPFDIAMNRNAEIYAWLKAMNEARTKERLAFWLAAGDGDLVKMRECLAKGENPNTPDERGRCPIHCAAVNNQLEAVRWLLEQEADIDATQGKADPPLSIAVQNGFTELVRFLLDSKAKINQTNRVGKTPLYSAVITRNLELTRLLLEHGADPEIPTKFKRSPRDEAVAQNHEEMIELLDEFKNSKQTEIQNTALNVDRVAIAGVDESVQPEELLRLSEEYPFVEWSVLYGKEVNPLNRFPSPEWIAELVRLADGGRKMNLSLHLCSSSVNVVFRGDWSAVATIRELLPAFRRIQLNVMYKRESQYLPMLPKNIRKLRDPHQIIVQLNGVLLNAEMGAMLEAAGIDVAYLHDMSGGHGKTPEKWLPPVGKYTGYAGGLTPENLREQIPRIAAAAGNHPIHLDLESGVRTIDELFDLSRVEEVLKIAKDFIV